MAVGKLRIALGGDHAGFALKEALASRLEARGYAVDDLGTYSVEPCDYPDVARAVAEAVSGGKADRGVLVCGTGAGMAMAANKVPGIRAAVCNEPFTAEYCRLHNDANVIALGARIIEPEAAEKVLDVFLSTDYEGAGAQGERHARRVAKIRELEKEYGKER